MHMTARCWVCPAGDVTAWGLRLVTRVGLTVPQRGLLTSRGLSGCAAVSPASESPIVLLSLCPVFSAPSPIGQQRSAHCVQPPPLGPAPALVAQLPAGETKQAAGRGPG